VLDRGVLVFTIDSCSGTKRVTYCNWIRTACYLEKNSIPGAILILTDHVSFSAGPE
jgi:hypothetical protein